MRFRLESVGNSVWDRQTNLNKIQSKSAISGLQWLNVQTNHKLIYPSEHSAAHRQHPIYHHNLQSFRTFFRQNVYYSHRSHIIVDWWQFLWSFFKQAILRCLQWALHGTIRSLWRLYRLLDDQLERITIPARFTQKAIHSKNFSHAAVITVEFSRPGRFRSCWFCCILSGRHFRIRIPAVDP